MIPREQIWVCNILLVCILKFFSCLRWQSYKPVWEFFNAGPCDIVWACDSSVQWTSDWLLVRYFSSVVLAFAVSLSLLDMDGACWDFHCSIMCSTLSLSSFVYCSWILLLVTGHLDVVSHTGWKVSPLLCKVKIDLESKWTGIFNTHTCTLKHVSVEDKSSWVSVQSWGERLKVFHQEDEETEISFPVPIFHH